MWSFWLVGLGHLFWTLDFEESIQRHSLLGDKYPRVPSVTEGTLGVTYIVDALMGKRKAREGQMMGPTYDNWFQHARFD
jgi:hypothetical protein